MTVKIGNLELKVYKRLAFDVIELAEFARAENSETAQIVQMCKIVADSLKRNAEGLRLWQFWKKRKIQRATSIEGVMKGLTIAEVNEIAMKVLTLEGLVVDDKKKEAVITPEGGETSQTTGSALD